MDQSRQKIIKRLVKCITISQKLHDKKFAVLKKTRPKIVKKYKSPRSALGIQNCIENRVEKLFAGVYTYAKY